MSALRAADDLTLIRALEIVREATKDQSAFELLPLGREAKAYLRVKSKRLTPASERTWESVLDKLARYFPALELDDFELPEGAERLETFMADQWGDREPRTYNRALSVIRDFFKWQVKRQRMRSNPATLIEPARVRDVERTVFTEDQAHAILASAESLRDRIALRLLLVYGLRQGALRAIQIKHFDYQRRRLTIFTKGGKVRPLAIPHAAFWTDLERYVLEIEAQPHHYLMPTATGNQWSRREDPTRPMSNRGAHYWWYARLEDAGIVPQGTTRGEKMHKARHSAGQRVLDKTGNLKAVQKLLGHASIQTTGDIYTGWDEGQLAASLLQAWPDEEDH